MIWLLSRLVVWPVKAVIGTAALGAKTTAKTASGSAKLGYRTGKLFGYRNMVTLGLGVAAGLALAPRPGPETREMVRQRLVELGLLKAEGGADTTPSAYAPVESPSPAPDVAAVGNGVAGGAPLASGATLMEGMEGPGAPATESRFTDEPGTIE